MTRKVGLIVVFFASLAQAGELKDVQADRLRTGPSVHPIASCLTSVFWFATVPIRGISAANSFLDRWVGEAVATGDIRDLARAIKVRNQRLADGLESSKFSFEIHGISPPPVGFGPGLVFVERANGLLMYPSADGRGLVVIANIAVHGLSAMNWRRLRVEFPGEAVIDELEKRHASTVLNHTGLSAWYEKQVLSAFLQLNQLTKADLAVQPGLPDARWNPALD